MAIVTAFAWRSVAALSARLIASEDGNDPVPTAAAGDDTQSAGSSGSTFTILTV